MVIKNSLPSFITITFDDFRLRTISKFEPTSAVITFSKKFSFHTLIGFTKLENYPRDSCISEKPLEISEIDIVHLKCYCKSGSIINGKIEPLLDRRIPDKLPGQKLIKSRRIISIKKVTKPIFSDKSFYVEVDKPRKVDSTRKKITFILHLIKVWV